MSIIQGYFGYIRFCCRGVLYRELEALFRAKSCPVQVSLVLGENYISHDNSYISVTIRLKYCVAIKLLQKAIGTNEQEISIKALKPFLPAVLPAQPEVSAW